MTDGSDSATAQPIAPDAGSGLLGLEAGVDFQPLVRLVEAGGPVTVTLLIMSVVATTVILIKLWQFARVGVGRTRAVEDAVSKWIGGNQRQALESLKGRRSPVARVVAHAMRGLVAGVEERHVREDVERVALGEIARLRSYLRVIEATVQIAPLLGLFGTVLGMISSFQALQAAGAEADPAVLAGGIWVALLTTAVGLAIAIPATLVLHWFEGRVEREREYMEDALTSVFTRRLAPAAPTIQSTAIVTGALDQELRGEVLQ